MSAVSSKSVGCEFPDKVAAEKRFFLTLTGTTDKVLFLKVRNPVGSSLGLLPDDGHTERHYPETGNTEF